MAIRLFRKKEEGERRIKTPDGMWIKCDACLEIIYKAEPTSIVSDNKIVRKK